MKKILLNNIGLKISTFICAFIFWQLIIGIADPIVSESFRDIQVQVINEDVVTNQGKVYQILDGSTVTVVVKGKTSVLRSIKKEDIIAVANFEDIELSSLIPVVVDIKGLDNNEVEANATPTNLKVSIEDSITKKFPIGVVTDGEVEEGYVLGETTVLTESVTVSGPESIIQKITKVEARIDINEIKEDSTIESELVYYDDNDVEIDQLLLNNELKEAVLVDVKIYTIKVLPLAFDTTGTPSDGYYVVDILAEPYEISVFGEEDILEMYEEFRVEKNALNLDGLQGKVEKVIDLLQYLPEGLVLLDDKASSVAVTVQLDEYGTKSIEIPVQSIAINNSPAQLAVEYYGITDVMLTFTGTDKDLEKLSPEDIVLSIDLIKYKQSGEYEVEVEVKSLDGVKLINSVVVPIKLTRN